ncbi:hypothetical protein [Gluconobacter albidus]|uniref:hypothetical protein n=1 Tax=Gluconobacter albidus TaxID=318683 RepID=UPI000785464F|nr:hypothetical protein [Gluconobacter albidus]
MTLRFISVIGLLSLSACAGNVSADRGHGPTPPPLRHASYDPGAAYGSANSVWAPPVYDRQGSIVSVTDPRTSSGRENYEQAPWAIGGPGNQSDHPPGTF